MSSSSGIAGLIPGANSSGLQISVPYAAQQGGQASLGGNLNPLLPINTSTSTSNPTFPQAAVSTSATSGLPAPSVPTSTAAPATPAFPANGTGTPSVPGGGTTSSSNLGFGTLSPSQTNSLTHNLKNTYGAGLGALIQQFLQGGAGYNSAAINNLVAGMQPQFQQAQNDLLQQFSAGGARYGSGAQLGESNLLSQQNLQVGELESQMYQQAVQNYISVLMGASSTQAGRLESQPSTLSEIEGALGTAASGAAGVLTGLNA